MVTLDTYSPTRTEPASMHKILPGIAPLMAFVIVTMIYATIITEMLDVIFLPIIMLVYVCDIIYLRYALGKQRVLAKEGQLVLSEREIAFNAREDGFRVSAKEVESFVLTYGGCVVKLFGPENSRVQNRVDITFADGQTFSRMIEIANRRQKKALKREIEELRKAGVRNITIRNASESEWGKF